MSADGLATLTVVILHHNQALELAKLIQQVPKKYQILVVDDYSQPDQFKKLSGLGKSVQLIKHQLNNDFAAQRNFALTQVATTWTLFLDADEQPTPEFWSQLAKLLSDSQFTAYRIHRRQFFLGHKMNYGEGGHQYPLRLAKTNLGQGRWQRAVHEVWNLPSTARIGTIPAPVWHHTSSDLKSFISKLNRYAQIETTVRPQPASSELLFQIFTYPLGKLMFNYFLKLGFLDGFAGLLEAFFMAYYSLILRIALYEKYYTV